MSYELAEDIKRLDNRRPTLKDCILHNEEWYIYHYIHHLRYVEYYQDKNKLKFLWHFFWYKHLGFKLRMTIYTNTIGLGCTYSIASEAFCMNQVTFALQNIKIRLWYFTYVFSRLIEGEKDYEKLLPSAVAR